MPNEDNLHFAILGPTEVTRDGEGIVLGGKQRKVLLTALLLNVGQIVTTHRLIEAVWDGRPPDRASATLRTHISELRRRLEPAERNRILVRHGPGYSLRVSPEQIDAIRAHALLDQGRRAVADGDPVAAIAPLQEAQGLWRGQPLADVAEYVFAAAHIQRLDELHRDVQQTRISADLLLGRHREIIGDLRALVTQYPRDDALRRDLVIALYRANRSDDATQACRDGLEALHSHGLDSPLLRRLQEDLLRGSATLDWTPPRALERPTRPTPPSLGVYQLPPDVDEFTGRDSIRTRILTALTDPDALARSTVVVAIAGKPGAGKTALAVHLAHQVREHFPDPSLFFDLRGNMQSPLEPTRVLTRLVQALGVTRTAVPTDPDDLVEMYHGLLANQRMIIVLDNAANEAQIRRLLPATPGCAVIVTSRARLHSLDAYHRTIDVLHPTEAVALLAKLTGDQRVEAEPEAVRDIAGLCGYLPMAIQIAGRKIAAHPHWRLARVAGRLTGERDRLSWLELGDLEVRASFALSYDGRPEDERQAFRLLALPNIVDFAPWAAAALLDIGSDEAEDVLDRLADAQLLERRGPDQTGQTRYRFHDLMRVFARERQTGERQRDDVSPRVVGGPAEHDNTAGADTEPIATGSVATEPVNTAGDDLRTALTRLLPAYLTVVDRATAVFSPGGPQTTDNPVAHSAPTDEIDAVSALVAGPLVWFGIERVNLHLLIEQAATLKLDEMTWRLAAAATRFYEFNGHWDDWDQTHTQGLTAARRAGDPLAEATMLCNLGDRDILLAFEEASWRLGAPGTDPDSQPAIGANGATRDHLDLATERFTRSLEIFTAIDHIYGEARSLHGLANACRGKGQFDEAAEFFDRALQLFRQSNSPAAEAETLVCLAMCHGNRQELSEAITCLSMSLSIALDLDNRPLEAYALRRRGDLYRSQARLESALAAYNDSLTLLAALPDPLWEPRVLIGRGDILAQMDDLPSARRSWQQGINLLRKTGSGELAVAEQRLSTTAPVKPAQFSAGRLLGGFDPAYFINRAAASRRIVRVLNTWTDLVAPQHEQGFATAIGSALDGGALVQILLLDPDSAAAAQRKEDLSRSVNVPDAIRSNLRRLDAIRADLDPRLRHRMSVRVYTEQPLASYHRWDNGAIVSTYPVGRSSAASTQHETTIDSTLVQFIEQRFASLWGPEVSTGLDDYLGLPLLIDSRTDGASALTVQYVQLDDSVYVADDTLARLVRDSGPDGVLAQVAGPGRHPLLTLGRCRVLLCRDDSSRIRAFFVQKYEMEHDGVLRLSPLRSVGPTIRL
ncbi:BTAD domain-containing putative transcriptional regulator [Frankia sp. Cr2]|uniref:BTAD domain-containing putative transcriptional regulator n=1 Tax=Frankia sp. Cr2 TaxID=3073932 RepID=UPI002AD3FC67|nr:BTAD domain-containing putative transcriptional regulator [Frankia sp. Cr2]